MVHFNQNKHINTLVVSVLRSQQVQAELQNSINFTYVILDNIFQILDAENVPAKQIIPCLAILSQKSENDIANFVKKTHNFIRKTKSYLKKTQMTLRNYIQVSPRKGKKGWACGCFLPKSRYHSIYFRKLFQF